jgi:thymidylate synthase (FAD)
MEVTLLAVTQPLDGSSPEALIELAGRVCYQSEPKGDPASFVRKRMQQGHTSIVEHVSFTFRIRGISRGCGNQLVRHRIASYSQASTRYIDMSHVTCVVPPEVAADPDALAVWNTHMSNVQTVYQWLRGYNIRKEDARGVLPLATETEIVATFNCRSLLNFFEQRLAPAAQWEIRELAREMLRLVLPYAPTVFEQYEGGLDD